MPRGVYDRSKSAATKGAAAPKTKAPASPKSAAPATDPAAATRKKPGPKPGYKKTASAPSTAKNPVKSAHSQVQSSSDDLSKLTVLNETLRTVATVQPKGEAITNLVTKISAIIERIEPAQVQSAAEETVQEEAPASAQNKAHPAPPMNAQAPFVPAQQAQA
jgi:hypothetical protein